MQFALTFLVCGALGWWLDRKLGSAPWLMIGGILAGAAGAMYSLIRRLAPAAGAGPRRASDKSSHPPEP
jgi:F0F1-type ATP synthase assembly protein I